MNSFLKLFILLLSPLILFANDHTLLKALNPKEQAIILISAFTANGEMDKLNVAFVNGLDAGLTLNEINEIIVHLYAYAGFPRSFNALTAFMSLTEERKKAGIDDAQGREASALPKNYDKDAYGAKVRASLIGSDKDISGTTWQAFAPIIDTFLKEHLFADIFARDIFDYKTRELITLSALAAMKGTHGHLNFHLPAALNAGLNEEQLHACIYILETKVDSEQAKIASRILAEVLKKRK